MTISFEDKMNDPGLALIEDISRMGKPLLIAFGGIYGDVGIPPFEFVNLTREIDVNKIYLRDLAQSWYHSGLQGLSGNIDETAEFLKRKVATSGADRVVLIGNSMGGYAAILFGVLINADVVHAFSPQTCIGEAGIIRSKAQLRKVQNNFSDRYFDLKELISSHAGPGEFNIYFNRNSGLDKKHALHLQGMENVTLHAFRWFGHELVKAMKDSGELRAILIASFSDTPGENTAAVNGKCRSLMARLLGVSYRKQ
jgi:hypothetical protein